MSDLLLAVSGLEKCRGVPVCRELDCLQGRDA